MSIRITTYNGTVTATFETVDRNEAAQASGRTLTEAIAALAMRFAELQEMAIVELKEHGVLKTQAKEGASS